MALTGETPLIDSASSGVEAAMRHGRFELIAVERRVAGAVAPGSPASADLAYP